MVISLFMIVIIVMLGVMINEYQKDIQKRNLEG